MVTGARETLTIIPGLMVTGARETLTIVPGLMVTGALGEEGE